MRLLTLAAAALLGLTSSALAQDKLEKSKVVLAAGSTAGFYSLPLTITSRLGLFKKAGLEMEVIDYPGGTKALQALMGGSADLVSGQYEHTIHLQAKGQYLSVFVLQGVYPGLAVALRPDRAKTYKSPADLKGYTFGVTAPGSGTHQMLNFLLAKGGLKPDDVAVVGVGSGPGAVAAMMRGEIDGIVNIDPIMTQVTNSGYAVIIADGRTKAGTEALYGTALPSASIYAKEEFLKNNPNTAQAIATAMVGGLKWLQSATTEQFAAIIPPEWLQGNKEFYLAAFKNQREVFSTDGRVPPSGAVKQLELLRDFLPEIRDAKIDLPRTYTNAFVDKANQGK